MIILSEKKADTDHDNGTSGWDRDMSKDRSINKSSKQSLTGLVPNTRGVVPGFVTVEGVLAWDDSTRKRAPELYCEPAHLHPLGAAFPINILDAALELI